MARKCLDIRIFPMFLCGKHKPKAMKKHLFTIVSIALSGTVLGQCLPPSGHAFLDVNNVSARLNNAMGHFWDEQSTARYEIPKGSGKHSLYAGSVWVGGQDATGDVKVAAVRYRQVGDDYWPGPISTVDAATSPETCAQYDRIWKLNRWQVAEFRARLGQPDYIIPQEILDWPAHGDAGQGQAYHLAPYKDVNFNGQYDPLNGDYPAFVFEGEANPDRDLMGDQVLWWIVNDTGNEHTETGGNAIGLEMHCMAYAFSTCNFLNDQTFYRYTLINRSDTTLYESYVGLWVDVDLGFAIDDYVACDVRRGMGYGYNGFAVDGIGGPTQYGAYPPAVGIDILKGPWKDADGEDNDADGLVDNETHGMAKFVYHNNSGGGGNPAQADPQSSIHYYNYLRGIWLDGTPMCYGGNGHPSSGCNAGVTCDYMFPGDSDPEGLGTGGAPMSSWTEQTAGNVPFDRRFMLSSGPFTFSPGDIHFVHSAAVWARDTVTNDLSVTALQATDDLVQSAFDAKFQGLECCPPDASIAFQRPDTFLFLFASVAEGQSYQWYFGDGQTSTERFPTHTYATYGTYNVCLNVTNACGVDIYCETVDIALGSTSIADVEAQRIGLTIHPNPTSSGFHIALSSGALLSVALTDALGRSILSPTVAGTAAFVPTDGLAAGIYFATVVTSKGTAVQRVVVQ